MALKNIVVTGANGMLGRDLVPYLSAKGYRVVSITRSMLDLLETQDAIEHKLETLVPEGIDVLVHAAAYTNVDGAEREPELAMAINKDGTRKLALACQKLDVIFAFISTDYVFDGHQQAAYKTTDRPNPRSQYGLSKYYAELAVKELLEMAYIIRTSWLYGIHKPNFVQYVLDSAREGRPMKVVTDQTGSPTWTGTLSMLIEHVITSGAFGTYHGCDQGRVSRYEQAQAICHAAGLSDSHLQPVSSNAFQFIAPRPSCSVLDPEDLPAPHWQTALHAYLEQYYQQLEHTVHAPSTL